MPTPADLASALVHALQAWINPFAWLQSAWMALSGPLFDRLTQFLTSTAGPLSGEGLTALPTVVHYATLTRAVADAALAGVLVWAFIGVMWQQSAYGHYRLRVLLPRLLLATVLVNFSLPLAQGAIDVNRMLARTVVNNARFDLGALAQDIGHELMVPPFSLPVIVSAALFVSLGILLVVYVLRYALLTVLVVTAPLAALLFVLHETSEHARSWSALFVSTLFMQPVQLLLLGIGWNLDVHEFQGNPLRHLFALACVLLCFRVPGVLSASAMAGRRALSLAHHEATHAWKAAVKVHA